MADQSHRSTYLILLADLFQNGRVLLQVFEDHANQANLLLFSRVVQLIQFEELNVCTPFAFGLLLDHLAHQFGSGIVVGKVLRLERLVLHTKSIAFVLVIDHRQVEVARVGQIEVFEVLS